MAISGRNKNSELNSSPIPLAAGCPAAAYAISIHTASCLHAKIEQAANYSIVPQKRHGQNVMILQPESTDMLDKSVGCPYCGGQGDAGGGQGMHDLCAPSTSLPLWHAHLER